MNKLLSIEKGKLNQEIKFYAAVRDKWEKDNPNWQTYNIVVKVLLRIKEDMKKEKDTNPRRVKRDQLMAELLDWLKEGFNEEIFDKYAQNKIDSEEIVQLFLKKD